MAHLRKASAGELKVENSHPFIHYGWIFCHNGTLHNPEQLENKRYSYEGSTDSERFFKYLIDRLYRKSSREHPAIIRQVLDEVREKCSPTSLTFILSSGTHLIACRDYACDAAYYTLNYTAAAGSFLVCSEPLPGFDWVPMKNGELIMVDRNGGDRYEL
jgi:predicted glutamine amidotransferase